MLPSLMLTLKITGWGAGGKKEKRKLRKGSSVILTRQRLCLEQIPVQIQVRCLAYRLVKVIQSQTVQMIQPCVIVLLRTLVQSLLQALIAMIPNPSPDFYMMPYIHTHTHAHTQFISKAKPWSS